MIVILNPCAGRGRGAKLRSLIEKRLPHATFQLTTQAGEAEHLARVAVQNGARIVVAGGGDGTLCEVLNGVLSAQPNALPTLGLLPLGTGNDFARTLGIGADLEKALLTLEAGVTRPVDVGEAVIESNGSEPIRRAFLNVCGAGIDSLNAVRINAARDHPVWRHVRGTSAYLAALSIELWNLKATRLRLCVDDQEIELRAVLCAVANARSYGGGMQVAPQARIDDGALDVVVIEDATRSEFLRAFPGVFKGTHLSHSKVKTFRGARIRLESDPPLPVLVDGEVLGTTPAQFNLAGRTIPFLAPPENSR